MTKFADELFTDLMREHRSTLLEMRRPDPPGRRAVRPLWMTSGVLAATGAAAVGFVVFGGGSPAYAVTENAQGTVTISVADPSGIAGANAALRSLGVPVVAVPVGSSCPSIASLSPASVAGDKITASATQNGNGSVSVDVHGVPAGDTAVAAFDKLSDGEMRGSLIIIKGKAPSCVSLPAAPSGGSGSGLTQSGGSGAGSGPTLQGSGGGSAS